MELSKWLDTNSLSVHYTGAYWSLHMKHHMVHVRAINDLGLSVAIIGPTLTYLVGLLKQHQTVCFGLLGCDPTSVDVPRDLVVGDISL